MQALGLNTVVLNDDARAANDLARVALTVDLAETGPGAEHLRVSDLDQVDLVLRAEGLDELDVLGFGARLDEDAQVRLALVKRLRALAETASETVVDESVLQNLLIAVYDSEYCICICAALWDVPEAHPRQRACPWEPQREPQPRPGRRLGFHQKRQTS